MSRPANKLATRQPCGRSLRVRNAFQLGAPDSRQGVVLVLVLVVIALVSLAAYSFSNLMMIQREATMLSGRQVQSREAATSGVAMLRSFIAQSPLERNGTGGWLNNPQQFQGVVVVNDSEPELQCRFSIVSPTLEEGNSNSDIWFGLQNESAKLNIKMLFENKDMGVTEQRTALLSLPGMTEDIVDAIIDWNDFDDLPEDAGAESEFYTAKDPPYGPRNDTLETIDELLLVRGITPDLLYGADANRNGMIDPSEQQRALALLGIERGLASYLTLFSAERNVNSEGLPKIDLTSKDMETLHAKLSVVLKPDWATFIVAYLQNGPSDAAATTDGSQGNSQGESDGKDSSANEPGDGSRGTQSSDDSKNSQSNANQSNSGPSGAPAGQKPGESEPKPGGQQQPALQPEPLDGREVDLTKDAQHEMENLLELIGTHVQIVFPGESKPRLISSPFEEDRRSMADYLPLLLDHLTTSKDDTIRGRININQAARPVLMGIPGITEEIVDQIIGLRQSDPSLQDESQRQVSWILTDEIVTLDELRGLLPHITTGGDVFRAQVVSFFDASSLFTRVDTIIDGTKPLPRVIFWRELNQLGRGYSLDLLGANSSR